MYMTCTMASWHGFEHMAIHGAKQLMGAWRFSWTGVNLEHWSDSWNEDFVNYDSLTLWLSQHEFPESMCLEMVLCYACIVPYISLPPNQRFKFSETPALCLSQLGRIFATEFEKFLTFGCWPNMKQSYATWLLESKPFFNCFKKIPCWVRFTSFCFTRTEFARAPTRQLLCPDQNRADVSGMAVYSSQLRSFAISAD